MKLVLNESIDIFPKVIIIHGYSFNISDEILIDFLKKDIWLCKFSDDFEDVDYRKVNALALFVNIDYFISLTDDKTNAETVVEYVVEKMCRVKGPKLFLTGSFSEDFVRPYLQGTNIEYIENWVLPVDQNIAEMLSANFTNYFYESDIRRTSLRISFTENQFKAKINVCGNVGTGYIENLSFKGCSIYLNDMNISSVFNLGMFVSIEIDFIILTFKISKGIVARKNNHNSDVSLAFDVEDPYMIDEKNYAVLETIIDSWLEKIISSNLMKIECTNDNPI